MTVRLRGCKDLSPLRELKNGPALLDTPPGVIKNPVNAQVPIYVENVLGFSPGMIVPVGYFDRAKNVWIPVPNGRVFTIVGITAGQPSLDVTGAGIAEKVLPTIVRF